jgi:hypothetical protein
MKRAITITLIIFTTTVLKGQNFNQQQNQIVAYNVGFAALSGSIGSMIHKKPNQSYGNAALHGAWKGAIGGAVCYTGKRLAYNIYTKNNLYYGWAAKLVHTTGASMMDNASANRSIMKVWSMEYGFLRFTVSRESQTARIQPVALLAFTSNFSRGYLNVEKSLMVGTPYFSSNSTQLGDFRMGACKINSIIIAEDYKDKDWTIPHEIIHSFQNRETQLLNNYVTLKGKAFARINKYVYLDIPYSDAIGMINGGMYEKEAHSITEKHLPAQFKY